MPKRTELSTRTNAKVSNLLLYISVLLAHPNNVFSFPVSAACKILAIELQGRLAETGKSSDVLELGYSVDDVKPKKKTEYRRS